MKKKRRVGLAKRYIKKRWDFLSQDRKGIMHIEGLPVTKLAKKYGTPFYVLVERKIREKMRLFREAFPYHKLKIQFASKCNSNLEILNIVRQEGGEIDASSIGEIILALLADFEPHQITFTNLNKSEQDIYFAAQIGVQAITVDSYEELKKIEKIGEALDKKIDVFIRVNPLIEIGKYSTKRHKYGIPFTNVQKSIDYAIDSKYLNLTGFHFHGGYVTTYLGYFRALKKIFKLIAHCKKRDVEIKSIDLGGGFPYENDSPHYYSPKDFGKKLIKYLEHLCKRHEVVQPNLIFEPGKAIVMNAGIGVFSVLSKKKLPKRAMIITDASTYGFLPDVLVIKADYPILPATKMNRRRIRTYDLAGCTCDYIDMLEHNSKMPVLEEGDLLAAMDCGAYSNVMSSNFNTLKRAPIIMVYEDGTFKLIRRRDRYSEMFAPEMDVLKVYGDPDELKKYYNVFRANIDKLWGGKKKNGQNESNGKR